MITKTSEKLTEQERVIFDALEIIDESLKERTPNPRSRPLRAVILFVEQYIVEVSGGDKENYADQTWFAVIYRHVEDWYDRTYGALMKNNSAFVRAVVLVRDVPTAFDIPLTRSIVEEEGKTAWLCFPTEIEETEKPKSWLKDPPVLSALKQSDLDELDQICSRTAVAVRKIQFNTQGLVGSSTELDGFVMGIIPEIEAAADHILRNKAAAFGLAIWSLQMALERTMKALALQRNGTFKETHDLFSLFDCVAEYLTSINRDEMKSFLRHRDVMGTRYGHGNAVEKAFILSSYLAGIEFIATATEQLERTFNVGGARILVKKGPWLSLPE